jgi:DNA-binding Lrp family transcriptional regulator
MGFGKLPCMKLKEKHMGILRHLRQDGRRSFSEISRQTGMPVTTVFESYNKLMGCGVIRQHACIVDFKRLGYNYRSFILVKAKRKEELLKFICESQFVNSIFKISNYDLMIDSIFPGMKEYYAFLDSLESFEITGIESHDVIDELKNEEFLLKRS